MVVFCFFFSSRRRHTRLQGDWSSDVCSSDLADGALWIWNLVGDRFKEAEQRLDFYHAAQHLWAVAEALHGAHSPQAQAWIKRSEERRVGKECRSRWSPYH